MNIILFDKTPENSLIPANDERALHILNILKLTCGDSFKMGIINESEGIATITGISDGGISFQYTPHSTPFLYPVTLIVAQVRPICMKRILREAVSLGVCRIILCGSDTGEKSYLSSNLYKTGEYKEYLLDGAMQACHAGLPVVEFADSVEKAVVLAGHDNESSYIMLDNITGSVPLSTSAVKDKAVLAIGPERGFSDRERKVLTANGYSPKLLGNRVLRTETACSAGIAVLLSRMNLL